MQPAAPAYRPGLEGVPATQSAICDIDGLAGKLTYRAFKVAAHQVLNFGYQGMVSLIDVLVSRHDVIVYDAESHACIIDGLRLHMGKRFVYQHNDIDSCKKQFSIFVHNR